MKSKITSVLRVIVCILTVFGIIGTFGVIMADKVYTAEYLKSQANRTNTYENAYNSLMKRFSDNYSISDIPKEIYEKSFTREWMKASIDEKINSSFEKREAVIDCSEAEANITEYFAQYAHEAHVIKDETYDNKLAESINYTQKTVLSAIDVYSFDVIKRAGISDKISRAMDIVRKYKYACIVGLAVLLIFLIILKRSVYWIGTALFSAGVLMIVPSAIVEANKMIQKFSIKDFTTYTLVTGTMESIVGTVLKTGVLLAIIGVLFIVFHCIFDHRGKTPEQKET